MIITKKMLNDKVPKEMMPTRLDSALNLYTYVKIDNQCGIIVYNTNPDTWNCLYAFYELNHKFTIDNYNFSKDDITYKELLEEYQNVYTEIYEKEKGFTKDVRVKTLIDEYKKTFDLTKVLIKDELEPIYELKFSKSKNVWTLYYFENYVAHKIDDLNHLLKQNIYEQKLMPLDSNVTKIDGIELVSNLPYLLTIKENVKKIEDNLITEGDN